MSLKSWLLLAAKLGIDAWIVTNIWNDGHYTGELKALKWFREQVEGLVYNN